MAEHAQKEPTMEEILASIRKIISEDDAPVETAADDLEGETVAAPAEVVDDSIDDDMFEEFDLSDLELDADTPEPVDDVLTADAADAMDDLLDDESVLEPLTADDAVLVEDEPVDLIEDDLIVEDDDIDVETFEPETVAFTTPDPEPEPAVETPAPVEEEMMQALTTEATESAAAGALAKLVARMDMGSENTIEGMVRELVRPMIKEWLDENLPSIVEEKVELEVQRISHLAR